MKNKEQVYNPWTIKSAQTVYENNWIEVIHHETINPSGTPGVYGKVRFKNIAVGILVLDENRNTWLVGQYRFPLNKYSWEIPEGGGHPEVSLLDSAKRELKEETGMSALKWEEIVHMHLSNSVSDEFGVVFLARDLQYGNAEPEETEVLRLEKIPFNEFYERVEKGEITDSLTVAAAYKVKCMLLENKL